MRKFETQFGAFVPHAWGMTEMSPAGHGLQSAAQALGLQARPAPEPAGQTGAGDLRRRHEDRRRRRQLAAARRQGLRPSAGARTPGSRRGYLKGEGGDILDAEGWGFDTGDVATIDPDGYMQITDRSKDVIKSGGEWISSIDLENAAVGHPPWREAAVIGVAHAKWQERPLLIVVKIRPGTHPRGNAAFPRWQDRQVVAAEDIVFVDDLPHTPPASCRR